MDEVLEISSESEKSFTLENDRNDDDDLYMPSQKKKCQDNKKTNSVSKSLDDNLENLNEKYGLNTNSTDNSDDYHPNIEIESLSSKERKQLEKEQEKLRRQEEKKRKKEEAERDKAIKQALATANKNIKPDECLKFINVYFDLDFDGEPYSQDLINRLLDAEITYKTKPQISPNLITWVRKNQNHSIGDDGQLSTHTEEIDTEQALIIMTNQELKEHLDNNTLLNHIQSLQNILNNKQIFLLIFGKKMLKREVEIALTELQLFCSCSHRFIDNVQELAESVFQFTKSVAQIPYKKQKYEKLLKTESYAVGDNKDCVKVDKDGNGLQRLWNQIFTMFPLARLEIAEAITSQYPTLQSLFRAYQQCQTSKEGELLLHDIPIRRAAGPLTTSRRIGPELSKKIYNVFTSTNGDDLL